MLIFIKMKRELIQEIEIPKNVEITIDGNRIIAKNNEGEISRNFNIGKIKLEKRDSKIIIGHKAATKNEKKIINTITAHINNMIKGINKKFEYKLKVCFSHFPITVEVKGKEALIKNFLGEKVARKVNIPNNVEVKVDRDTIKISSIDKELAGQAAANFETATKIAKRDRRIFQDGIYIVNKDGKEI